MLFNKGLVSQMEESANAIFPDQAMPYVSGGITAGFVGVTIALVASEPVVVLAGSILALIGMAIFDQVRSREATTLANLKSTLNGSSSLNNRAMIGFCNGVSDSVQLIAKATLVVSVLCLMML